MNENQYPNAYNNNETQSSQNTMGGYPVYPSAPETPRRKKLGFGAGLGVGFGVSAIALLVMFITFSIYVQNITRQAEESKSASSSEFLDDDTIEKIQTLKDIIDRDFYNYNDEDITVEEMRDGMYKGLVSSLNDKYAAYYTEEELQKMLENTEGVYYGIGAYISLGDNGYPYFSGIMEGTPAENAGLHDGDIIYKVNDESAYGMTLDDVVARVKGAEGTQVHLTLVRDGEDDYLEIDVTRGKVETPTVKSKMLEDNIGYIQITEFDSVTITQFETAYNDIRSQGAEGMILDLRSNPGGLLNAATDIARMILPEGVIVYEMNNQGVRKDYVCDGENEIDMPLVVLVNENSASAAEILSGSIRDYGVGTLVGKNTYGKGIVQSIQSLPDNTAIKLTISAYYLPNGECIQGQGIAPDVEVELDVDKYYNDGIDTQLDKAIEVIKEK